MLLRIKFVSRFVGVSVLVAGLGLGGCATNQGLIEANRTLTERNKALQDENQSLQSALDACQSESAAKNKALADLMALRDQLTAHNQNLLDQLAKFGEDLRGIKFTSLDTSTDAALRELAAQYPDLITYDPERGLVRFKSDLTFASGSDVVNETASQSLSALSRILMAPAAAGYDIRVIGHTDTQRISAGTAQKHPTNWHLSTHRAISVGNVLIRDGVEPTRVECAGRGEFDPIAPDGPRGNTPANRRVEIYIYRSVKRPAPEGAPAPAEAPERPAATGGDIDK
jgi:chemotaxis protein MotB